MKYINQSPEEIREIFKTIDSNGDIEISRIEFMKALRKNPSIGARLELPSVIQQEDDSRRLFQQAFQDIDTDDSKTISLEEFTNFYRPISVSKPVNSPRIVRPSSSSNLGPASMPPVSTPKLRTSNPTFEQESSQRDEQVMPAEMFAGYTIFEPSNFNDRVNRYSSPPSGQSYTTSENYSSHVGHAASSAAQSPTNGYPQNFSGDNMQVKHVWEYQTVFQTTFQEVEVDEVVMVPRLVRRRIQQAVAVPVTMPVFKTYCRYRLDTPVHVPAAASPVPASPVNFVHAQQEEEPEIVFTQTQSGSFSPTSACPRATHLVARAAAS